MNNQQQLSVATSVRSTRRIVQVAAAAQPTARNHFNGVKLPVEEHRENRSRPRGKIAAIDFGTANCSVAYCLEGETKIRLVPFGNDVRVPTAIVVDAANGAVVEFGKNARRKYATTPSERRKNYHLFTEIKMNLQHDKNVAWTNIVESKPTHNFFAVEVIAFILKYLKDKLLNLDELARGITGAVEASDFHWVITVPAMWKARGKQMMREAAYMAGIANDGDEISKLTIAVEEDGHFKTIPCKPLEIYLKPKSLSLALEPEVAALHCINQAKEKDLTIAQSSCYMVLDIGGGTVDITAHKVTNGCIEVVLPPKGNDWGGKRVNEEFKMFLESLVDDEGFKTYLLTGDPETSSKNYADLDWIINHIFEEQKQFFGDKGVCDDEALINIPYTFMMKYESDLRRGVENLDSPYVRLSGNELVISYCKMEEFFHKAITGITSCVMECIREVNENHKLESIFFVGGFGGCKYLHDRVKEVLGSDIDTFCPRDHKTAIVCGAVLFGQNPSVIKSRIADATYGTDCLQTFDPKLHDRKYLVYDDDRMEKCDYLFKPFVYKGDVIHADKVLVTNLCPSKHFQKNMYFEIFTTHKKDLKYAKTPEGKIVPQVLKIGELTVKMPDTTNDKNREVKLTFDFSHTEIHIEAHDLTSGEKVTTIVDFLSDLSH